MRGIEEAFLPRVREERTLRLADKAFQRVPQLESGAAKHRDHFCSRFARRQRVLARIHGDP